MAVSQSKNPLERFAIVAAPLFLTVPGVHGQAPAVEAHGHWCATTIDLPEVPPVPQWVIDSQMVEAPAASETVVIGVLFLYTEGLTESAVRRKSVEWIKTANQLLNAGTLRYRIVLKRAGVRAAPERVSQAPAQPTRPTRSEKAAVLSAVTRTHRELQSVRAELGADLVTVVLPGNVGGIAWIWYGDTPPVAFVRQSYNVISMDRGGYLFAHEVGHNLGLLHDWEDVRQGGQDPAAVASALHDPHGFGYVADSFSNGTSASGGIGTVMAQWVSHDMLGFSRPEGQLGVVGRRLKARRGDSTTNADRALRATAATVAAFYEAAPNDPDPPPEPKPDPPPPKPDPDPPPRNPGPPPTGSEPCVSADGTRYCHVTGFGPFFAVQYFHEGEWRFAEVAVNSGDSAVFHFFGPDNLEVFAKVLNGCAIDGTVWVYASGLTDLPIVLHVWPEGGGQSEPFQIPDGTVLRPQNGGRLNWCR